MRVIPWLIAVLAFAFGYSLWRVEERSPLITRADRRFHDWLIDTAAIPRKQPVSVVLVEMEDPGTWTALEYSLFLKALPKENPPVVVLSALPEVDDTAFTRAFHTLVLQQPRLVLPVRLSSEKPAAKENYWWLNGWRADSNEGDVPSFESVTAGPPENLRGSVAVGVAQTPADITQTPLFFRLNGMNVPSLAFRAVLLVRKISGEQIRWDNALFLGKERLHATRNGTLAVDPTFLPGLRRVRSSDLLLNLAGVDVAGPLGLGSEPLRGVLVLGDTSAAARKLAQPSGPPLTEAEWIAATVATICNGPVLTRMPTGVSFLIMLGCVLIPFFFFRQRGSEKWLAVVILLGVYLGAALQFASSRGLASPIFTPVCVLLFGSALQHLAALSRSHE